MSTNSKKRDGVTVIEVLFATGIVIFGLIGIASLISVAGRQALQSNEAVESQAVARVWYSDFVARGMNNSSTWLWYNDANALNARFVAFDNSGTPATNTSAGGTRLAYRHAICIDPLFYADVTNFTEIQNTFDPDQAYRPGLFPYFQDNYIPTTYPVTDPSDNSKTPGFVNFNMPRLLRVSFKQASGTSLIPAKLAEQWFMSADDLAKDASESDKTLAAVRVLDGTGSRVLSGAKYSWLATLCPREFLASESTSFPALSGLTANTGASEKYYTLSIVVMSQRDKTFFIPTDPNPENVPGGERVLDIAGTTFTNGGGGRVILSGSTAVSDRIRVGDWVMLAKQVPSSTVCRWYRVIGLDAEPTINATTGIWSRNVILDGPDWVFDSSPTQATLLNNVVTVLERVIPVY